MKKQLLIFVLTLLPVMASADAVEIDGIYYNLYSVSNQAEVTSNPSKYSGDVTIPDKVTFEGDEYSVTSISGSAFSGSIGMTSVFIPQSVTYIGCCSAFVNCSGLSSIKVESGNPKYDSRNDCNAIIETESNTLIAGCKNTKIPNSVTSIGGWAFSYCSGLTSIDIPNSVTSIGENAFCDCKGLTSVTIPNSVKSFGMGAFVDCTKLSVVISKIENPYSIDGYVFSGIFSNAALIVPVGTKDTYLSTAGWSNFKTILEDGEGGRIGQDITVDGILYKIGENNTVSVIGEIKYMWPGIPYNIYSGDIVIPNLIYFAGIAYSVTSIGNYAFSYSSNLTSVTIPNSVKSIGALAFSNCSSLTAITIPYSVTSIDYGAFGECSGLMSIIVEDGNMYYDSRNDCNAIIKTEKNELFVGCQNTIIPATVTSITGGAFSGCSGLTTVTIPSSVISISSGAFSGCSGLISIKVESGNTYYDSRDNCNAIIETSSNTLIRGCNNTIIPNSVTSIGESAFLGCNGLTSINIPSYLTSIGSLAFSLYIS